MAVVNIRLKGLTPGLSTETVVQDNELCILRLLGQTEKTAAQVAHSSDGHLIEPSVQVTLEALAGRGLVVRRAVPQPGFWGTKMTVVYHPIFDQMEVVTATPGSLT